MLELPLKSGFAASSPSEGNQQLEVADNRAYKDVEPNLYKDGR
jgi:hypothetical protein